MFTTDFEYTSSTPLPDGIELETAVELLHQHNVVVTLDSQYNSHELVQQISETEAEYRVDTQLSFIPRSLWKGGVKYTSVYTKLDDGCDITVDAPFFKSVNRWRIETNSDGKLCVAMTSESNCGRLFAGSVKSFTKSSHEEQQLNFIKALEERRQPQS